jgi:N-acetylmuramoyl-L-alanine amidase
MSKYTWLLENGHGGIINGEYQTAGKRSPVWPDGRQLFEGEFNRDVVRRIAKMLKEADIDHFIIVKEEQDISLSERVIRANNVNMGNNGRSIYISVHANAGGGTGYSVYTSVGETRSDKMATVLFNEMAKEFPDMRGRKDMSDGDVDKEAQFYVLKYTHMPAMLSENFFMDTLTPDCELIMSDEGRERVAKAHFRAILAIEADDSL